jgi:hypothetical protein
MPNNITLAQRWTPLLDEVFASASVTQDLTGDPAMAQAGANANEIKIPKLTVDGLGDYSRNSGYTQGFVSVDWETVKFNYDRGRKFHVDVMDNEETFNIAFGRLVGEFLRTKVAPEADAFTFASLAGAENISTATPGSLADGQAFLAALLKAWSKMTEDEVPEEQRLLYATPTLLDSVIALDTTKSREILARFSVKKSVPQSRFYTAIELKSGGTGEEAGHFVKTADAKNINFMIVHKSAIIKFDKHVVSNIIPAAQNPDADADIVKYRKYGLVDTYENKRAGIYLHAAS